ncbi:sce7726 family protein [Brevundimonas diminuta]|uniref:sce7726 family protein n=1 Tax=Brevundimonas diminuta TaxID=293 RepID=UPI003979F69A
MRARQMDESTLLRDGDIRRALEESLVLEHRVSGDTTILHEMKVYRPTARADVAVVNGEITAFEIKSDVDSFARLKDQVAAYNTVFDRVSIVTTARQLKLARQKVPCWWGIATSDGHSISVKRSAKKNPNRVIESLLFSLSRRELIEVLKVNNSARGQYGCSMAELISLATQRIPEDKLRASCRGVLKLRRGIYISPSSSPPDRASICSAE